MEIELHPAVSMLPETFNVLIAPVEMLALKQTSREATILLYSPALDPSLQKMTGAQATLEAYS